MASKRNHKPDTYDCYCNKCGAVANAPPGKPHRTCPSANGQEEPGQHRGQWEKGTPAPKAAPTAS